MISSNSNQLKTQPSSALRSSLPQKLFLTGLGIFLALVLCEVALRLVGYSAPIFREPDDALGWRGAANLGGWHRLETKNYTQLNSGGYYDREHSLAKPDRSIRIAVVGDSYVQACEVPLDQHFVTLLERQLTPQLEEQNLTLEVLNFGITGYSPAQELMLLKQEVKSFNPDIVVLAIYAGNDIADNRPDLATSLKESRPYFEIFENKLRRAPGYPDLKRVARDRMIVSAVNHVSLLQLVKEVALKRHSWDAAATDAARTHLGNDGPLLRDHSSENWVEAWTLTESLISHFAEETALFPAQFLLMIIPLPIQVHPNQKLRQAAAAELDSGDLDYATTRLESYASAHGLSYLSLAKPFKAAAVKGVYLCGFDEYTKGKGHWNARGHALVSELLAKALSPHLSRTLSLSRE